MQRRRVTRQRILSWFSRRPPEVRESHHSCRCAHQGRNILQAMPRGFDEANGRRDGIAFRTAKLKFIALIDGPVVVKTRLGKQSRIERMVWMMMRKDHIRNRRGRLSQSSQRLKDALGIGYDPQIDNHTYLAIPHEAHG